MGVYACVCVCACEPDTPASNDHHCAKTFPSLTELVKSDRSGIQGFPSGNRKSFHSRWFRIQAVCVKPVKGGRGRTGLCPAVKHDAPRH